MTERVRLPYDVDLVVEGGTLEAINAARTELARIEAERRAERAGIKLREARCLDAAHDYARREWPVLPLHFITNGACSCRDLECTSQGKHPLGDAVPHGQKDATTDETTIRRWWARFPRANVGIRTGAVSGLVVLDVDPGKGGEESLARLIAEHGPLPVTREAATGSGGRHIYLIHPGEGRYVPCSVGNSPRGLGPGLDVRGDGGFVVAPPSRSLKGSYAWR